MSVRRGHVTPTTVGAVVALLIGAFPSPLRCLQASRCVGLASRLAPPDLHGTPPRLLDIQAGTRPPTTETGRRYRQYADTSQVRGRGVTVWPTTRF